MPFGELWSKIGELKAVREEPQRFWQLRRWTRLHFRTKMMLQQDAIMSSYSSFNATSNLVDSNDARVRAVAAADAGDAWTLEDDLIRQFASLADDANFAQCSVLSSFLFTPAQGAASVVVGKSI